MNLKKVTIVFFITITPWLSLSAQQKYVLSGTVTYNGDGLIYIYLVNEEVVKKPFTGIQTIVLTPDSSSNILPFSFPAVEAGIYGIRCYQDANGNEELDRGIFGPAEPWGMSWQGEKPRKWPKWEDFSFEVKMNISEIHIILEE